MSVMSSDPSSWKEVKPELKRGPKIWEYTRGYKVNEAGRHENEKEYRAFQHYLNSAGARSYESTAAFCGQQGITISAYAKRYNWDKRCAAWDKQQMALTFKEANKIERNRHREAIQEFRQANEDQAKLMMDVSSDLMGIIQSRIAKAHAEGEEIPMALVSGLMRAAANISDTGRQAWATSLGVNELMQVVDQELSEHQSELEEVDVYEIPLDE